MFEYISKYIEQALAFVKKSPQLFFTVFVALVIFASFFIVTARFVGIAQDAQERLIDVRIGSIQDTFVLFAPAIIDDPRELQQNMEQIVQSNQTIVEFEIVRFESGVPIIIASLDDKRVGLSDRNNAFLYNLALTQPNQSFRGTEIDTDERFFRTARTIVGEDGEILGVVSTRQTLSEADKRINDSIRNSLVIFSIIVFVIMLLFFRHARIIDYTTLYKRLKEIDQLKDDFIAMASHELRTPLTVIRGYAEELSTIPKLSEEGRSFIRYIDLSARQLDDLVSDMLDVSKIEQNRMEFVAEEIDVLMFANEITKSFQPRVKSKELALLCTGDAAMISVDKKRFRQVLINLIGNAVKYTQKGSVKIRISLRKKNIVEIRVSDTGIGMTAEEQKRLFEKFYRIKNEDTKDIRGSGLGLWLTKALVENMGGTLSVESIKGVGTHFIISFPHA